MNCDSLAAGAGRKSTSFRGADGADALQKVGREWRSIRGDENRREPVKGMKHEYPTCSSERNDAISGLNARRSGKGGRTVRGYPGLQ
jgi:hypothetical protein